ncbi:ABC transporter ATP-binding protein, partial [Pseudomonas aeruginosa]|uniref:ABC transporter ATP-binding protein n=1 Tax=Pseudomonas aeruginosa TaxID=287 RepID=UPI000946C06B
KSTLLSIVAGLDTPTRGTVKLAGDDIFAIDEDERAALRAQRVGFVFQSFQLLGNLSALENVMLPLELANRKDARKADEIYAMFPNLAERRHSQGTRLSGGEQQMLAVARILRTGAKLLLLDEISEGLAPVIVQALARMITTLRSKGYTIVMVEQNFRFAAPLADRFYVMEHGRIALKFGAAELEARMPVLTELLGV